MSLIQQVLLQNQDRLKEFRLIVVQHLMSDTYEFLAELLHIGVEIHHVFAKEYSCEACYFEKLQEKIPIKMIGDDMPRCYQNVLEDAIKKSEQDGKSIAILDLGGEFAPVLPNVKTGPVQVVVVEDTAFGHRKYEQTAIQDKNIRLYSVAKSKFKEIEARFVGKSIVDSAEQVFRSFGKTLVGKNVLVIGYGMIGKNVCQALAKQCCKVSVYDQEHIKMCGAYFDGFSVGPRETLLKDHHIIFGVTGNTSIDDADLAQLADQTVLISGSSKQIEFSKQLMQYQTAINPYVDRCHVDNKDLYIINKGYPVNFISKSVPDSIIEFMFAEMTMCLVEALEQEENYSKGVRELSWDYVNQIAQQFLMDTWKV